MKGAGCLFMLFLVLLSLGLGGLYALRQIQPDTWKPDPHQHPHIIPTGVPPGPSPEPAPEPSPDPDRYKEWVSSLNEFEKRETPDAYQLSFGFIDHNGTTHHVDCSILRSDYEHESAAFGYVDSDVNSEIDARLQSILNRELAKRALSEYVTIHSYEGGSCRWNSHFPAGLDSGSYSAALGRLAEFKSYLENQYEDVQSGVMNEVYEKRGFRYSGHLIAIDHGALVMRNQLPLSDCFGALRREARNYNERQFLGMYLAFFQEIRYEVPPDVVGGKHILGLYVPTEVLVNDHGDCDSKSLAFSAMMRSMMKAVMVVDLPNHVLVAVETHPGPGQSFVRLGNRYFVLCEVAGPAKLAPGEEGSNHNVSGYFDYTLIEPVSSTATLGSSQQGAQKN